MSDPITSVITSSNPPTASKPAMPWQAPLRHEVMHRVEQRVIKQLLQALIFENVIAFDCQRIVQEDRHSYLFYMPCPHHAGLFYVATGDIHDSFGMVRLSGSDVLRVSHADAGMSDDTAQVIRAIVQKICAKTSKAAPDSTFQKTIQEPTQQTIPPTSTIAHTSTPQTSASDNVGCGQKPLSIHAAIHRHDKLITMPATLEGIIQDILQPLENATFKAGFIKELRQTLVNDVQAQCVAEARQMSGHVDNMSYDELEQYLITGHPYHPCYKSRLGFSIADNEQYGPEFGQDIQLIWLAVDKSLLAVSSVHDDCLTDSNLWITTYLGQDHTVWLTQALSEVLQANESLSDYGFVPVHPWQWHNTLIQALHPLLTKRQIFCLGYGPAIYRAQQSIRTLEMVATHQPSHAHANQHNHGADTNRPPEGLQGNLQNNVHTAQAQPLNKAYIKLAMHLTNTSSTRILAKHTVMNAPVITTWLNQLITDDEIAQTMPIAFLGEHTGISLDHDVLQAQGYHHPSIYGGLGVIWRENIQRYLSSTQQAFPFNGVSHVDATGQKLIEPWLKRHGIETWTKQLIEVTVPPLIHMLFAHGVALESHAQNIVLVHEAGYPIKIVLKDLHDGVRYSPKHLTQPERAPHLHRLPDTHAKLNRGSFIETQDTDGIRDMAVACLFFVALADIAIFLQTHYKFPEAKFWQLTADCILHYQQAHPEHQTRFELFDVFAEKTRIESLAKRRLFGDAEFPIKFIDNPLHRYRA